MYQIILETLRMYPPVFGISKKLESPLKTDNFLIPAGCDVFVSIEYINIEQRNDT